MILNLYRNLSDERVINKTITDLKQLTGQLYMPTDILNPQITVDLFPGIFTYNYAYIPAFERYYFINDINISEGSHVTLTLSVDVLETWWNKGLGDSTQNVIRQENNYNMYIPDNRITLTGRYRTQVVKSTPGVSFVLPSNETARTYVLNTM